MYKRQGVDSHINIARKVDIGDEVGIGIGTKIFTHGAYLSAYDGFPVQWGDVVIGNNVWLPHAWVNPSVVIGDNVVVSAMSLVNRNLPSGCLAGGIPAKILHEDIYPRELIEPWIHTAHILEDTRKILGLESKYPAFEEVFPDNDTVIKVSWEHNTFFNLDKRTINGQVNKYTRVFKNQLRRNGIRFRYKEENGEYVPW